MAVCRLELKSVRLGKWEVGEVGYTPPEPPGQAPLLGVKGPLERAVERSIQGGRWERKMERDVERERDPLSFSTPSPGLFTYILSEPHKLTAFPLSHTHTCTRSQRAHRQTHTGKVRDRYI